MRTQSHCQIAYRSINVQDGKIVLDDAILLDCSKEKSAYHIRAEEIRFDFSFIKRKLLIHVDFIHPHVTILRGFEGHLSRKHSRKWIRTSLSAADGTFEWQNGSKNALSGCFSLDENKVLHIESDGGFMHLHWIRKNGSERLDCSFDRWSLSSLVERFTSWKGQGFLSGNLQIQLNQESFEKANGHLRIEECSLINQDWQMNVGAASIDWQGEHIIDAIASHDYLNTILSFPDRYKILLNDAFIARKESRLEHLNGVFSSNCDVGPRFEISNGSFTWEGRGFSKSLSANWFESHWRLNEAQGKLSADQIRPGCSRWMIELNKADRSMVELLEDLIPIEWPCRMFDGLISARFTCLEEKGSITEWNIQDLEASRLGIRSPSVTIQCEKIHASLCCGTDPSKCSMAISIENGEGLWGSIDATSMNIDCRISDGEIDEGSLRGIINQIQCDCAISGSLTHLKALANVKGSWSQYWFWQPLNGDLREQMVESVFSIEGDYNAFSASVRSSFSDQAALEAQAHIKRENGRWNIDEASLKASQMDLSSLRPLINAEMTGRADLKLRYLNGELEIEGAGSSINIKKGAFALMIPEVGRVEPFTAGLKAVWNNESNQWILQTTRLIGECSVRGWQIPFEGEIELINDSLKILVMKGSWTDIEFCGEWLFELENQIPFSFVAQKMEGGFQQLKPGIEGRFICQDHDFQMSGDLLSDPHTWEWQVNGRVSGVNWGAVREGKAVIAADSEKGLIECSELEGQLAIGQTLTRFRGAELRRQDKGWIFDLRVVHQFWDFGSASRAK